MYEMINKALERQHAAKKNMHPWNPRVSLRIGKILMQMNANVHTTDIQNETPKSFHFSGITSDMTRNGSVRTAHDAIKMTNEKLVIGTQLNASTSMCQDFSII